MFFNFLENQIDIFTEYFKSESNLDCNHTLHIDLTLNGIPYGAKSIGKVLLQSKFVFLFTRFRKDLSLYLLYQKTET